MDTVEVLTDEASIDALQAEWEALVARSPAPSVFLTPQFVRSWWEAYGGGLLAHLVTVRRDGRLVVVAPLAIGVARVGGRERRGVIAWANEYTDRFGPVVDAGALDGLDAVAQHLGGLPGWRVLELPALEQDSPVTSRLQDALAAAGIGLRTVPTLHSPWIDLPASWDEMEARLGSSFRSTMRRKHRSAERAGLRLSMSHDAVDLDAAFAVARTGWAHDRETSIASTAENRRFVSLLAAAAADRGWLRLAFLHDGDRPVAYEINLLRDGDAVNLKVGFDPDYARASPGLVLRSAVVRSLLEEGARSFDLLGEAEGYKLHWTDRVRTHVRLRGFPATMGGRIEHWYRHRIRPMMGRVLRRDAAGR